MAALAQNLVLLLLCSLGLLLLPAGAQSTTTRVVYVKPTEDTSCPEPCYTLDEYVQNASRYFVSNTTFNFLPGNHNLSESLTVSGVTNLALVAINATVNITCHGNVPIMFTVISDLTLENLTFYSCPAFDLSDLLNLNLLGCHMEASPLQDSWQLTATDIFGNSSITRLCVSLPDNQYHSHEVQLFYTDNYSQQPQAHNHLTIKDISVHLDVPSDDATAFHIDLLASRYSVSLVLDNISLIQTNISVVVHSQSPNHVTITNLKCLAGSIVIRDKTGNSRTSAYLGHINLNSSPFIFRIKTTNVTVEHSVFQYSPGRIRSQAGTIIVRNVTFMSLSAVQSLNFLEHNENLRPAIFLSGKATMVFIDCSFINNTGNGAVTATQGTAMTLSQASDITFTNCEFRNNTGTAITAVHSGFVLTGSNVFSDNRAYEGGAMAFYGMSTVTLASGSNTSFINNTVETVGGAIYVSYYLYYGNQHCFLQVEGYDLCEITAARVEEVSVNLINNTAANGGNVIYGASFETCLANRFGCNPLEELNTLFPVKQCQSNSSDYSAITSDPIRACLCVNGRPSCTTVFSNLTVYPGETFQIPAVVVGDRFGTVDGSVYAQIVPFMATEEKAQLQSLQVSQRVEHRVCTNVSYTILTNSSTAALALTANSLQLKLYPSAPIIARLESDIQHYTDTGMIKSVLRSTPVYINVSLLPCPLGFVLSGEPPRCNCHPQMQDKLCNLTTQTVQRSGSQWVNATFQNMTYSGVIVSKYCPNNYCKPETVNVNLEQPDTQCAFNHSGILCGGCQSGLSLALGSAQCLSCSNAYLALLIPFALAGFALVFFIKILNLTVAEGTLNGLIFYANIVRANQVVWVPKDDTKILTTFIAWLNLDLGIETCFFDGLDAYWRTWLQFVFPLYIWAIVLLIIVLSYYFSTAAKLFGNNSVRVLATLFLLSYSKLLRIFISIIQASTLDGSSVTVWSYDGNIRYLGPRHAPLFVLALTIILFLWLPYTGILCFAQCLQRIRSKTVTNVYVKMKPFLDAYVGPFKDKHRYWVGLLLLVRGVLLISFAAIPESHTEIELFITLVIVLCLLMYLSYVGQVYRKNYLSFLENSFLVNLGILAGGTLSFSGESQSALVYTSLGVTFLQFIGITIHHAIVCVKDRHTNRQKLSKDLPQANDLNENPYSVPMNKVGTTELTISFNDFREPVLKYVET